MTQVNAKKIKSNSAATAHTNKDALEFIKNRTPGKPKIEITRLETKENRTRTVVRVLNDDKPFLVDSVVAEITKSGYKIYEINHPIIKSERDAKGTLVASGKGTDESLIEVITTSLTEAQSTSLEQSLFTVLDALYAAVTDWKTMLTKVGEAIADLTSLKTKFDKTETAETLDFLHWLADNHFTFLGYAEYTGTKIDNASKLGVLKQPNIAAAEISPETALIEITKSDHKALVHRSVYMDQIIIKKFDSKGAVVGERCFVGLFASSAYYQTASQIPIIRRKLDYVLEQAGFNKGSHNGKIAQFILDSYPRDEIFQSSPELLLNNTLEILALMEKPDVGFFARSARGGRFLSCLIYVPKEKLDTALRIKIQHLLENELGAKVTEYYTQITDSPLSRFHLILKPNNGKIGDFDDEALRKKISDVANLWSEELANAITAKFGGKQADDIISRYEHAFEADYSASFNAQSAVNDIAKTEEALKANQITVELFEDAGELHLKTFSPAKQILLSDVLPVLENLGLKVIAEQPFEIKSLGAVVVYLSNYQVQPMNGTKADLAKIKTIFEEALIKALTGEIENDSLNKLVLFANLPWRDVVILRAYSKYLMQVGLKLGLNFVRDALTGQPQIAALLTQLFYAYFDPKGKTKPESVLTQIEQSFASVTNLNEDRALRRMLETINASLRTNFFLGKSHVSIKLNCKQVPELPLPRPLYEIFVYSPDAEGVHLRGGMVARGGLRWSDRHEDFRTEVLGLMKAQMVKNSVIVPVGSKGGFVVKNPALPGTECYKIFLRGILDITDNIIGGKITPPANVVRRDSDDPYLVVAADKGTATFSDIANGISAEYGFWLGDAFASGGSAGYDHKKMGITAKGGWISVQRHFREMGIDVQKQEFTVIGVGDMAGDVFGNGMLLSDKIRLVAAFNHMHIFFDPYPDAAKSFVERSRLFALPRSSWEDYDRSLISKGGGIFKRSEKSIKLTPEMQDVLDIKAESLTPDELIRAILTAPVDLLWNGGIGTYVKAESESHRDVGDKNNDNLRVNGRELRCKVMGEGGNLGFTQLGRIEFAQKGGRINTDAIDNSAGVDCSDHEVNIKIAFSQAKNLSKEARDKILESMTDEVADLVLRDNYLQTQAISIAETSGADLLESQSSLMKKLGEIGLLNRGLEFLPDDEEIAARINAKKGLTRPELAVILAYSKLWLYQEILDSTLPDEDYFKADLMRYFPLAMQEKYKSEIENHKLRREIVATFVTNSIVNRAGSTFFHNIIKDTGQSASNVARTYTAARDTFALRDMWKAIEQLDGRVESKVQYEMFIEIGKFIERQTFWYLREFAGKADAAEMVKAFSADVISFNAELSEMLNTEFAEITHKQAANLELANVPANLARQIAALPALSSACDIISVSKQTKLPIAFIGKIYFEMGEKLGFNWLRAQGSNLKGETYWQRLATRNMVDSLYEHQRRLTAEAAKLAVKAKNPFDALESFREKNQNDLERHARLIAELKATERTDLAMLVAAVRRVETLCS